PRLRRSPSAPWSRSASVSNTRPVYWRPFPAPAAGRRLLMPTRHQVQKRVWGAVSLVRTRLAKHEVLTYASAVAFQAVKSLIPLVLLGLALLGTVGRRAIWTDPIA